MQRSKCWFRCMVVVASCWLMLGCEPVVNGAAEGLMDGIATVVQELIESTLGAIGSAS